MIYLKKEEQFDKLEKELKNFPTKGPLDIEQTVDGSFGEYSSWVIVERRKGSGLFVAGAWIDDARDRCRCSFEAAKKGKLLINKMKKK